jgi:hypothetical protein
MADDERPKLNVKVPWFNATRIMVLDRLKAIHPLPDIKPVLPEIPRMDVAAPPPHPGHETNDLLSQLVERQDQLVGNQQQLTDGQHAAARREKVMLWLMVASLPLSPR